MFQFIRLGDSKMTGITNIKDIKGFRERKVIPIRGEPADVIPFTGKRVLSGRDQRFARWGIGFLLEQEDEASIKALTELSTFAHDCANDEFWLNNHGINYLDVDQPGVRDRINELAYLIKFMDYPIIN
jgi:hypothetical protein